MALKVWEKPTEKRNIEMTRIVTQNRPAGGESKSDGNRPKKTKNRMLT